MSLFIYFLLFQKYTRDPKFESSHLQLEYTVRCVEKTKVREKMPGKAPVFNDKNIGTNLNTFSIVFRRLN